MSRYLIATTLCVALAACSSASAQSSSVYTNAQLASIKRQNSASGYSASFVARQAVRGVAPTYAFSRVNQNLQTSYSAPRAAQKPFTNVNRGSVSPYLGLSAPFSSTAEQYYTQVRPQIQQQRVNQQNQQRYAQMQHQLNAVAARPPYDPTGSETMAPTGHVAVFMNYGGYYPETDRKR